MDFPVLKFQYGQKYHIGQLYRYKIHICTIVDKVMIVYKYYSKKRKKWIYKVEDCRTLSLHIHLASKE